MSYEDLSNPNLQVEEDIKEMKIVPEICLRGDTPRAKSDAIKMLPVTFRKSGLTYVMKKRNKKNCPI